MSYLYVLSNCTNLSASTFDWYREIFYTMEGFLIVLTNFALRIFYLVHHIFQKTHLSADEQIWEMLWNPMMTKIYNLFISSLYQRNRIILQMGRKKRWRNLWAGNKCCVRPSQASHCSKNVHRSDSRFQSSERENISKEMKLSCNEPIWRKKVSEYTKIPPRNNDYISFLDEMNTALQHSLRRKFMIT